MRTLLLFILIINSSLYSQRIASDCTFTPDAVKLYKKDASIMALFKLIKQNRPEKDSIIIPKDDVDTALRALIAVYNAKSLPYYNYIKTVFNHNESSVSGFTFYTDTSIGWSDNLVNRIIPCGNDTIDELISNYDLKLRFADSLFGYNRIEFQYDSFYNSYGLINEINKVTGVQDANNNLTIGDGDYISDSITPNFIDLTYSIGYEDCPSGCMSRFNLKVRVYNDCSVEFISKSGIPPDSFAGINSISEKSISIFPNPVNDIVNVKSESTFSSIKITNTLGQTVFQKIYDRSEFEVKIDLTEFALNNGIYYISIGSDDNVKVFPLTISK